MPYASAEARKACHKRWRERNKAKHIAWGIAWAKANPEKARARGKRYYDRHREERCADAREWSRKNPEIGRANAKRWYYENRERAKENSRTAHRNRRARLKRAFGVVSTADFREIVVLQGQRCAECRRAVSLTMDHIIPLARGGEHDKKNIQALCMECNQTKHARDPIEFARSRGRLL
jgi:5-methylcytosine-specific restriction endonuclease McrA